MGKRVKKGPYLGSNQHERNRRSKLTFEITPELGPKGVGGKHPTKARAEKRAKEEPHFRYRTVSRLKAERELERLIREPKAKPKKRSPKKRKD